MRHTLKEKKSGGGPIFFHSTVIIFKGGYVVLYIFVGKTSMSQVLLCLNASNN